MRHQRNRHRSFAVERWSKCLAVVAIVLASSPPRYAQQSSGASPASASDASSRSSGKALVLAAEDRQQLRVVPLATGLSHPWGLAFLPGTRDLLVTERPGRLRIIRDGVLDQRPIAGVPSVNSDYIGGLND